MAINHRGTNDQNLCGRRSAGVGLLVLVGLTACGGGQHAVANNPVHSAAAPARGREPAALLEEVTAFAARLSTTPTPLPDSPDWVAPPTEAELVWMTDRATALAERFDRSLTLTEASRQILHAYLDVDLQSIGGLHWMASLIRQQGILMAVMLDEFIPTISPQDPTYAARIDGVRQMRHGAIEVVLGVSSMLHEGHTEASIRLELVEALRDHLGTWARAWTADERAQADGALMRARDAEPDPDVAAALGEAHAALAVGPQ